MKLNKIEEFEKKAASIVVVVDMAVAIIAGCMVTGDIIVTLMILVLLCIALFKE